MQQVHSPWSDNVLVDHVAVSLVYQMLWKSNWYLAIFCAGAESCLLYRPVLVCLGLKEHSFDAMRAVIKEVMAHPVW